MNDIQIGDTVEVLKDDVGFHPTENDFIKQGDRVVVSDVTDSGIWYECTPYNFNSNNKDYISFANVKKVVANQVEVKFR
jgi:hypothetical protein